jgi:hypothetical protein
VKQIVDTCLLKCFLLTNEHLVGSLVRLPNCCSVEETEQLLLEFRKYNELIDFYHGKDLHKKALSILKRRNSFYLDLDRSIKVCFLEQAIQFPIWCD